MFDAFKSEVLDRGPEACLPSNLPDKWLLYLGEQAEKIILDQSEDASMTELMSVIVIILSEKRGYQNPISINIEEIFKLIHIYAAELALEVVSRKSSQKYEPATLANILDDRDVKVWTE